MCVCVCVLFVPCACVQTHTLAYKALKVSANCMLQFIIVGLRVCVHIVDSAYHSVWL